MRSSFVFLSGFLAHQQGPLLSLGAKVSISQHEEMSTILATATQKKEEDQIQKKKTPLFLEKRDSPHASYDVASDPNGPKPAWDDNPLADYFFRYTTGLKIWKWHNYFRVYHRHLTALQAYKGQRINMLVLGVQSGGEVGMWQEYFGNNFHYYGVDINPACKTIEQRYPNTHIFIGDQGDPTFLSSVRDEVVKTGPIHIILDDGSHINWHQIMSFETLYPHLHPYGGVYIIEDCTTSYNPVADVHRSAGPSILNLGAVSSPAETLVEHMKNRVDYVNGYWRWPQPGPAVSPEQRAEQVKATGGVIPLPPVGMVNPATDPFVTSVLGIGFYDGMVVAEKMPHPHPTQEQRGTEDIPYCSPGQKNGCLTL